MDSSKLKEFADDNFKCDKNSGKLSKKVENAVGKGEIARYEQFLLFPQRFQKTCTADTYNPGLVWESVKVPVEATFLSGVISPLTTADACGKSSRWLWKEKLCKYWCEKARKHICVIDRHDMTLAVKVALNPNTTKSKVSYESYQMLSPILLFGTTDLFRR